MTITFKKPKYLPWYTVIRKLYVTENDFCKKCSADKIKDQKEIEIIPHQSFLTTFTFYPNALLLLQTRKWFSKIPANVKIYNPGDNSLLKKKQFSKISGKTANDMKIKEFLKNEDCKKYKRGGILNYVFFNLIY